MTGNNTLLDTSIIIEVFGGNKVIADKLEMFPIFNIPVVVLGELYTGINRVVNKEKHLSKLQSFLEFCVVLNVDTITARYYGEIIAELHRKGKPLPINDVWIAAIALQHNLTIITRDKHFKEISNLKINNW